MLEIYKINFIVLAIYCVVTFFYRIRKDAINSFKISYYETKLKNRDVDISNIENITIRQIIKL